MLLARPGPVSRALASVIAVSVAAAAGCMDDPAGPGDRDGDGAELGAGRYALSAEVERERVTAIRDVAAGLGMLNGPLLAGIAQSETNLAHCWSEATWACQGPSSPSCGGGPVIAGAADGPCSAEQGGLGMFQFDAGTYAQTLARDGEEILLLEGNIAKAVDFVQVRVIQDIAGAGTAELALAWMNSIPMQAGDPLMEAWASFIVCRYNGCCSTSSTCTQRRAKYRDNAIDFHNKYGADFWGNPGPGPDPEPDPDDDGGGRLVSTGCAAGRGAPPPGLALLLLAALPLARRRR
jgi:MYXO-CTERM domain-containing protein